MFVVGYAVEVVSRGHKLLHERLFLLADDPNALRSAWRHLGAARGRFKGARARIARVVRGVFKPW